MVIGVILEIAEAVISVTEVEGTPGVAVSMGCIDMAIPMLKGIQDTGVCLIVGLVVGPDAELRHDSAVVQGKGGDVLGSHVSKYGEHDCQDGKDVLERFHFHYVLIAGTKVKRDKGFPVSLFSVKNASNSDGLVKTGKVSFKSEQMESRHALVGKSLYLLQ